MIVGGLWGLITSIQMFIALLTPYYGRSYERKFFTGFGLKAIIMLPSYLSSMIFERGILHLFLAVFFGSLIGLVFSLTKSKIKPVKNGVNGRVEPTIETVIAEKLKRAVIWGFKGSVLGALFLFILSRNFVFPIIGFFIGGFIGSIYGFLIPFDSLWKKWAKSGMVISSGLLLLFWILIAIDKSTGDAFTGLAVFAFFSFLFFGVTIFTIVVALIGYSFENKGVRFRVLGASLGLIILVVQTYNSALIYGSLISRAYITSDNVNLFRILPILIFYSLGHILDKWRPSK
jgi:hypothetical protein